MTIGDPLTLTVTVEAPPQIKILAIQAEPDRRFFEIRKNDAFKRTQDGFAVTGQKIVFTSFGLGDYVLEPARVDYRDASGQVKTVYGNKVYVTIQSVIGTSTAKDIHDAKGVVSMPRRYVRWLIFSGAALAVFVTAGLLIRRRLKSGKPVALEPGMQTTLEQAAISKLNELFDSALLRQGKYREYFFTFSEILRGYMEKRFLILAVESTTDEIMKALRDKETPAGFLNHARETLEAADLAKFAKWKPDPAEVLQLNQSAKSLIELAAPREARHGI